MKYLPVASALLIGGLTLTSVTLQQVLCMMRTCPESAAFPSPTLLGNESDRLALLDFKKRITEDPLSVMSSWNHSIHFCSWVGITCHRATQRVLIPDLEDKQLVGSIPPSIGNLTCLIEISLGINKFHGEIPQELGRLRTLKSLNLSFNSLGGKIPINMSHCTQLRFFDLFSNPHKIMDVMKIAFTIKHSHTIRNLVLLKFLRGFILLVLCMISTCPESATFTSFTLLGNESDRLALLDFKKRITEDPLSVMSSWNHSVHFCSWVGITCHRATERVLILDLEDKQLVGSIPPSIGNLTCLIEISLGINKFHGEIPQELGRLRTLESLNLSFNSLGGKIPTNMSHCTQLRFFDLLSNKFIGSIPSQLSSWLSLTVLQLGGNNLSGTIPCWIGNFSSLRSLRLGSNNFQGSIPNEFAHITTLKIFIVGENNLSGMFPSSIYNISSIYKLSVARNQLHGQLPPNLGILFPNLVAFYCGNNNFTGNIPHVGYGCDEG
ncbi:hypothetical protein DVH24_003162 [Malus domestica]|uniref:Leucine-rich repeat-containing N-terminal plant-type domain-containing protein n=1 Tax=Malus domestica TaxID=3750 RepID=A0A498K9S4_MALDO|nr:hypothetical protein DVH24_003162 [Malus domestica]